MAVNQLDHYLERLGLHAYEAKIYLALLDLGTASITDLVRATGLHRPIVYQWLDSLTKKHLIAFSPKKRGKLYYAEPPERLQQQLQDVAKDFASILPALKNKYEGHVHQPKVRYFAGEDVVTAVYEDVLATCQTGDVFYRYESPRDYKKFDAWLPPAYFERVCKRKEIEKYIITNEKTARTKKRVLERVERAVPTNFDPFEYDITQIIYQHKVAFIDFETKTAWIIESPRFATFQRQLFKLLFNKLDRLKD